MGLLMYSEEQPKRDVIVKMLKERGCRITKQRLIILDVVLENQCSCCKEIHFKASKINRGIGTATVYRMMNTLEEIGVIRRGIIYNVS